MNGIEIFKIFLFHEQENFSLLALEVLKEMIKCKNPTSENNSDDVILKAFQHRKFDI